MDGEVGHTKIIKRTIDAIYASIGLMVLIPIFIIVGILIRIESKGSII